MPHIMLFFCFKLSRKLRYHITADKLLITVNERTDRECIVFLSIDWFLLSDCASFSFVLFSCWQFLLKQCLGKPLKMGTATILWCFLGFLLAFEIELGMTQKPAEEKKPKPDSFSDQTCPCSCSNGQNGHNGSPGRDGRDGKDGKNGAKGQRGPQGYAGKAGQKGEPGPPGETPQGAIKFSDTADKCTLGTAGTVRYSSSQNSLLLCDGSAWLSVVVAGKGHVSYNPGRHCLDILNSGQSRGSGLYWIDPNGGSTDDSFQAFCDMETESGGWTLVATKVSPGFPFIKTSFSPMAAKTKYADAASHIHPDMGDWEEVMFRFADANTIRIIYNKKAGAPQNEKKEFEDFLMGKSSQLIKNVYGFYKYDPRNNGRSSSEGFVTITNLHFYSDNKGISEAHSGTDKWIDMWHGSDSSNNYVTSDDSRAVGTKCIAGYCYLNKPIWVMVR